MSCFFLEQDYVKCEEHGMVAAVSSMNTHGSQLVIIISVAQWIPQRSCPAQLDMCVSSVAVQRSWFRALCAHVCVCVPTRFEIHTDNPAKMPLGRCSHTGCNHDCNSISAFPSAPGDAESVCSHATLSLSLSLSFVHGPGHPAALT